MRELRVDDSSNVRRLTWNEGDTLDVEFTSGAVYKYQNVQLHQLGMAATAESVGSWVQKTIVRNPSVYPCTKLTTSEEAKKLDGERRLGAQLAASVELGLRETLEYIANVDPKDYGGAAALALVAVRTAALTALGRSK